MEDREAMWARLNAVYESGSLVPVPFLSAAAAANPFALLADVREPYLRRGQARLPSVRPRPPPPLPAALTFSAQAYKVYTASSSLRLDRPLMSCPPSITHFVVTLPTSCSRGPGMLL